MLIEDNQYHCSKCDKKCDAKKRFSIEKSPRTLIIHLKRFDNFGRKIKQKVQFPKSFSLKSFKSESVDRIVGGLQPLDYSQLHKEATGGTHAHDLEIFELYGYVVHNGITTKKGHYYSVVRGFDGQWYQCNDRTITLLQGGIEKEDTEQAYILFYQKKISSAAAALNSSTVSLSSLKITT